MPRTYPARVNGQIIDASHIDVIQDDLEVVTAQVINVRESTYGAVGDGVTDDTAAIQSAIDACSAAGGGTVYFPDGRYALTSSQTAGTMVYQLAVVTDNVRLEFAPGAVLVSSATNARVLVAIGGGKPSGIANWASNEHKDATAYDLTGTATKGKNTVTTTTVADAGNFSPNDYVYIRTGQTLAGSADDQPDSEINQVLSVNATTGVVTLRWPLVKTYQAENYVSGSTGISAVGGAGTAAPYKISKVNDRTLLNFELVNPHFECSGTVVQVISIWQGVGFRLRGGNVQHVKAGLGSRDWRFAEVTGCRFDRRDDGTNTYWIGPSTGCSQWNVHDCEMVSDGDGFLHMHEGVAQSQFHHNRIHLAQFDGTNAAIDVRARGHDLTIEHNDLFANAASATNAVLVTDPPSSGRFAYNRVVGLAAELAVRLDVDGWSGFETNSLPGGRFSLRAPLLTGKGVVSATQVLSGWVLGTAANRQLTPTLGELPRHAIPLRVTCYVRTAFNSDGTDTLVVGYSGSTSAYATSIDVSTTGIKTVTAGTGLLIPEETIARSVIATYTNGGSLPTTGEAFVALEYALGPRRD